MFVRSGVWCAVGVVALCTLTQAGYGAPVCAVDVPLTLWVQQPDEYQIQAGDYVRDLIDDIDTNLFVEQIGRLYNAVAPAQITQLLLTDLFASYREELAEQSMSSVNQRSIDVSKEQLVSLSAIKKSAEFVAALTDLTDERRIPTVFAVDTSIPDVAVDPPPPLDTAIDDRELIALAEAEQSRFHLLVAITALRGEQRVIAPVIAPVQVQEAEAAAEQVAETEQETDGAAAEQPGAPEGVAGAAEEQPSAPEGIDGAAAEQPGAGAPDGAGSVPLDEQAAAVEVVAPSPSYVLSIEVETIAVNSWRDRIAHATYTIPIILTNQSQITDLQAAIRDGVREQLTELRSAAILLTKYRVLHRDRGAIFLDNNGDEIPLGYEFIPLLPSAEQCSRAVTRTALRAVESYENFALLRNISGTARQTPEELLADPVKVIIETHLGYVFPILFQRTQILAPFAIIVGGVQVSPALDFGLIRPFFQAEVHAIIDQIDTYVPVAAMGGVELIWHIGPLILKPSLAGGVSIGVGISRATLPFFFTAVGGSVKLFTGVHITRSLSLFLETGYTQWVTLYTDADSALRINSYALSIGYGGVEVSLGLSAKL